jgi:hypothetical protein
MSLIVCKVTFYKASEVIWMRGEHTVDRSCSGIEKSDNLENLPIFQILSSSLLPSNSFGFIIFSSLLSVS